MSNNRIPRSWRTGLALSSAFLLAAGCGQPSGQGAKPPPGGREGEQAAANARQKDAHGHDHPSEGPHHGPLAEWGEEEFHAEFTVDHKAQEATVYILDRSAKKAKPIEAKSVTLTLKVQPPVTLTLEAKPQERDPAGKSSRFVGKHAALGKEMEFTGTISGEVDGKPYAGDFKQGAHGQEQKTEKK
jgi:hypothetical protein